MGIIRIKLITIKKECWKVGNWLGPNPKFPCTEEQSRVLENIQLYNYMSDQNSVQLIIIFFFFFLFKIIIDKQLIHGFSWETNKHSTFIWCLLFLHKLFIPYIIGLSSHDIVSSHPISFSFIQTKYNKMFQNLNLIIFLKIYTN